MKLQVLILANAMAPAIAMLIIGPFKKLLGMLNGEANHKRIVNNAQVKQQGPNSCQKSAGNRSASNF